jgi:hypothetical protein
MLCTVSGLSAYWAKAVFLGSVYSDNIGIEDILALPFTNSGLVLFLCFLLLYVAVYSKHSEDSKYTPLWNVLPLAPAAYIATTHHQLYALLGIGWITVVPLVWWYFDLFARIGGNPIRFVLCFAPFVLVIQFVSFAAAPKHGGNALVTIEGKATPLDLVATLHNGVIVSSSEKSTPGYVISDSVFVPWDKVSWVSYAIK